LLQSPAENNKIRTDELQQLAVGRNNLRLEMWLVLKQMVLFKTQFFVLKQQNKTCFKRNFQELLMTDQYYQS